MRSLVAVLLGLCSVMVAIPVGCTGPEAGTSSDGPSSGSGSGTGGGAGGSPVPIDGYKECTEYCTHHKTVCPAVDVPSCITGQCEELKKDLGPQCQDEFDAYFACVNAWVHTLSPDDPDVCLWFGAECGPLHAKLSNCQYDYGCVLADGCWGEPAPNGGTGCYCRAWCQQRELHSLCWTEGGGGGAGGQGGGKQVCDCVIDGVSVGMCEQQPELVCWQAIFYDPCCLPYFMIP